MDGSGLVFFVSSDVVAVAVSCWREEECGSNDAGGRGSRVATSLSSETFAMTNTSFFCSMMEFNLKWSSHKQAMKYKYN